ncbi:MAG TPA: MFS transporter [Luteolibacter sp.]
MSKPGIFTSAEGRSLAVPFILVSSLFFLWGFCNGMIDVMDKHFQKELHLTLAQSAWVQFAHYLGYFLMAMPAGWLASKLGYKGGIIAGLLMVAVGGFWFIPATKIATFPAFLLGVCVIASGLTFLETVANPYSTVLGPKQFAATRINLAQSCNGIGWIFGPIAGGMFFYGQDASGKSTGSETLWIPYAGVGVVVLILSVVFFFCKLPDLKSDDEFHLDDEPDPATHSGQHEVANAVEPMLNSQAHGKLATPKAAFSLLWLNIVVLSVAVGMIFSAIVAVPAVSKALGIHENEALLYASLALTAIGSLFFFAKKSKVTRHSIWSQPHFSGATLTQFFYVAAQCGIFAYFINYMTMQVPAISPSWKSGKATEWIEIKTALTADDLKQLPNLAEKLKSHPDAVSAYLYDKLTDDTRRKLESFDGSERLSKSLSSALARDLTQVVKQEAEAEGEGMLYDTQRFAGVSLGAEAQSMIKAKDEHQKINLPQLNRYLLSDAYPGMIAFNDTVLTFSDKGASFLASVGFFCFLAGRFIGAALLKKYPAHKILAIFAIAAGVCSLLVFGKLGWISASALFLSYFFMSIMFPTIFSLGIHGLGARAKKASSFIVMAIMGGAIMPKLMGHIADERDMSFAFIVPIACFIWVACYGLFWSKLSGAEGVVGVDATKGH